MYIDLWFVLIIEIKCFCFVFLYMVSVEYKQNNQVRLKIQFRLNTFSNHEPINKRFNQLFKTYLNNKT